MSAFGATGDKFDETRFSYLFLSGPVFSIYRPSAREKSYQFEVSDNGSGISPEDHQKIFDRFQIVDENEHYGEKGFGIGLAMVKKIAQALGGDIFVESNKGKGACFIFSIER